MISLSIIIPARQEPYLQQTIDSLLSSAQGEIEIIAILDGYWPEKPIQDAPNVHLIHFPESRGMRASINTGAKLAKGKYLMKCDAHCIFADGFDEVLKADCKPDYTLVPTRYSLDSNKWERKEDKKYEFEYISSDDLKGKKWPEYADRVKNQQIVDLMTSQGSCWFMHWQRFWDLGGLDDINYGSMGREAQEICLKSWLSGGRYALDRNTWYAHWSKGKSAPRFAHRDEKKKSVEFATDLWLNDKWHLATRTLDWLVDKFAPVPTWDNEPKKDIEMNKMNDPKQYIKESYQVCDKKSPVMIPEMGRAGLYRLFADLGFKVGCEVGVQRGRNAWVMLQNIPDLKLYLVEPYNDHPSNNRKWGQKVHDKFKKQAHNRLKNDNVEWLEGFSEQVIEQVPDGSLDFVYIDGEHTYDFVMIDIILWSRKVRKGGIISGHDYEYWKPHQPKVAKAINNYSDAYGFKPLYITDKRMTEYAGDATSSWFWVK